MRGQSRVKDHGLMSFCKAVWEQAKIPLSMGAIISAITCTLVWLTFGTSNSSVFVIASIGSSFLVIPVLIVAISHYLDF